jgi:ubiquinone/menaquinone biosynthesis C-methylase UbiE
MTFDAQYYDNLYYADPKGKEFHRPNGHIDYWGYRNATGEWLGADIIAKAWKEIFKLEKCDTDSGLCKACDIGCGRGQFVCALRNIRVEAWGFDFSQWAIDNKYKGCQDGWIIRYDATDPRGWPYGNNSFDLTIALDFFEHLYIDDIDFIIREMYRVSKRFVFLQIAVCGTGGLQGNAGFNGYVLKKGEKIPIEFESMAVAGHVTVCRKEWWINKLNEVMNLKGYKFIYRDDLVGEFVKIVPGNVIENWVKNAIIILQRI